MANPPYKLILLRHGESSWNRQGLFTGWVDVPLSERGEEQAREAGQLLKQHGLLPVQAHTSVLKRAIRTAELALAAADLSHVPLTKSWRLNERHYGALQGKDKKEVRERYGEELFKQWRRSYDIPPPPLPEEERTALANDPRYAHLPPDVLPASECLKDVLGRVLPYWQDVIAPQLRLYGTVLVCAHGNSLRALVKHLDRIPDEEIPALDIPTGMPVCFELDDRLAPTAPRDPRFGLSGTYLDPERALAAAAKVKAEGHAAPTGA